MVKTAVKTQPYSNGPIFRHSIGVSLREVLKAGERLEASAFNLEAKKAIEELDAAPYNLVPLFGHGGLAHEAHNAFRFKRIWVRPPHGIPFLSSSDIIALNPEPEGYLSLKHTKRIDHLKIRLWDVLISCSGTIGNVALAGQSIEGMALSQHAIRLRSIEPELAGFIAAFLRTRWGRLQMTQATYGSVVVHIEPNHLKRIQVPDIPTLMRFQIGRAMVEATEARDEANNLLKHAGKLLHERLGLPPVSDLGAENPGPRCSQIRASTLEDRLEGSYHSPEVYRVLQLIKKLPITTLTLGDPNISKNIFSVTKFRKRVYVPKGGIPMLSSKQIFQIDPIDIKRLAKGAHTKDLPEIQLAEHMVLVTRSGTTGKTFLVPKYMSGWTASEHANRIVPADTCNPGYLYVWLASDLGQLLVKRQAYGSVIQEIDRFQLATIPVPWPSAEVRDEIGNLALRASTLRTKAWILEQKALEELNDLVLGLRQKDITPIE
ncbi:restriction endonuclease subunit S [Geothrix fermentans]|uniref:restriction endonuclease subunit S n=1 Tax=Geothrix fermentans TaxID=44676 RepID=UPI0004157FFE|nr:restriction endonuclease subunit S [Geothrix fermentans]